MIALCCTLTDIIPLLLPAHAAAAHWRRGSIDWGDDDCADNWWNWDDWEDFWDWWRCRLHRRARYHDDDGDNACVKITQWASTATASSEYGSGCTGCWSAQDAVGPRDSYGCGDTARSWSPKQGGKKEWLQVGFRQPVYATSLAVWESYNPPFVYKVELVYADGSTSTRHTGNPGQWGGDRTCESGGGVCYSTGCALCSVNSIRNPHIACRANHMNWWCEA